MKFLNSIPIAGKTNRIWRFVFILFLVVWLKNSHAQWVSSNNGVYGGQMWCLLSTNGNIFAGTLGGLYLSSDNGDTWGEINNGIGYTNINDLEVISTRVFAATNGGPRLIYVTSDNGTTWSPADNGLPENSIIELAVIGNVLFALNNNYRLFMTADNGESWNEINTGLQKTGSMTTSGNYLFAGTPTGIYRSADSGSSWTPVNSGISSPNIYSLAASGINIVSWTDDGTYFSNSYGNFWTGLGFSQGYLDISTNGSTIIVGNSSVVYRSTNSGASWFPLALLNGTTCLTHNGGTFFSGNNFGVKRSVDNGTTWNANNYGLTNTLVFAFSAKEKNLFAATGMGVFRSSDDGHSWSSVSTGLPVDFVTALTVRNNNLLAGVYYNGIYRSVNDGSSWDKVSGVIGIKCFIPKGSRLFAGGYDAIYVSDNDGATWSTLTTAVRYVTGLAVGGDTLFASSPISGVHFSINNGQSWTLANTGIPMPSHYPATLYSFDGKLFAGIVNGGVYVSLDRGANWGPSNSGLSAYANHITSFTDHQGNLFTGGSGGVYSSANKGASWTEMNENLAILPFSTNVESLVVSNDFLFAGTYSKGIWRWSPCIPPAKPAIAVNNEDEMTIFTSNSAQGNQWFLESELLPGATNPDFIPTASGDYTVQVNSGGCPSPMSESASFFVIPDPRIEMPNFFSPNGDLSNAAFIPITYQSIKSATLRIYNRWGEQIFYTENLIAGWDGGEFPSAVYYYAVSFDGMNEKVGNLKGFVQLTR